MAQAISITKVREVKHHINGVLKSIMESHTALSRSTASTSNDQMSEIKSSYKPSA